MPERPDHLSQAERNEAFRVVAQGGGYCDWGLTALFYAALHYVDAYLATQNVHPATHAERNRLVSRDHVLRQHYPSYRRLQDLSHNARYGCYRSTEPELDATYRGSFTALRNALRAATSGP